MNPFKNYIKATYLLLLSIIISFDLMAQDVGVENPKQDEQESLSGLNIKSENNIKTKIPQLLFKGILIQNQEKKQDWYIPSLFELLPPNTVEGFVINPKVSFTQHLEKGRFINLKPSIRYGFGSNRFYAQLSALFYYAPSRKTSVQLSGGRFVEQFSHESTLNALNNTYYTFLNKENFLKIYERDYLEINHTISPIKDFLLTTTFGWNNRSPLQNLPKYNEADSEFTSNIPVNKELPSTDFEKHQAVRWDAQLTWQFGHQHIRHSGAFKSFSSYPAITLSYSGAVPDILGSDLSYQKMALQITDIFNAMKWGTGQFSFEVGDFISKDKLTFIDFNHFNGKRTVYGDFDIGNFQLLDYYEYSTADFYIQGHYEHQWNGLTNKNKSSLIKPVIAFHYLYTPAEGSYLEAGIGLNKILNLWRVDFYSSWRGSKHERFGLRFGVVIE